MEFPFVTSCKIKVIELKVCRTDFVHRSRHRHQTARNSATCMFFCFLLHSTLCTSQVAREGEITDQLFAECIHFLRHCESLGNLRELRLDAKEGVSVFLKSPLILELLKVLAAAAASVTHLDIDTDFPPDPFPELTVELLECMPRLQTVKLGFCQCRRAVFPRLLNLAELKEVSGSFVVRTARESRYRKAIRDFKLRRPDVKTKFKLTIMPSPSVVIFGTH